jgi:hypothetical protein
MTRHIQPRGPWRTAWLLVPLLALAAFVACGDETGGPVQEDRPAAAPEPLTPRGAVSLPTAFTWKPVPGDRIYRVIVTDAAERLMYQQDIRNGTRLPLPKELKAMMAEQHATFSWSVAIITPDGRHLAQSPPVQFSLK